MINEKTYNLSFITKENFVNHVKKTIKEYDNVLNSIDLKKFNSNIIDPIKLTFDKFLFKKTWEEILMLEIHRQRDKTNSNSIGYFHQNIFQYFNNCVVPKTGHDIIFTKNSGNKICVEMKNKHNTMNSSSMKSTYIKLQNHILSNPNDECYLVEVIAPCSRNIPWKLSIDGQTFENEKIRRVSIDQFYSIVTGIDNAFYLVCNQLTITIDNLIKTNDARTIQPDTVIEELKKKNPDLLKALYLLAFNDYMGFEKI